MTTEQSTFMKLRLGPVELIPVLKGQAPDQSESKSVLEVSPYEINEAVEEIDNCAGVKVVQGMLDSLKKDLIG